MRPDAISIVLFAYTVFYLDSTSGFWPAANSILDLMRYLVTPVDVSLHVSNTGTSLRPVLEIMSPRS